MNTGDQTLQGKHALVTGAGSGIGRAIAIALAANGATVALLGRRKSALEATAAAISAGLRAAGAKPAELGTAVTQPAIIQSAIIQPAIIQPAIVQPVDVTDKAAVERAVSALAASLGNFDILVNNAGAGGPNGCLVDGPDRWDTIVRTNLDGMFFVTRAALRHFRDGGRVVNVSSVLGKFGVPGYTAYCASKHGVIGFTKALALEGAPRQITVNAICPGWVDTDMAREGMELIAKGAGISFEEARRGALAQVPLGRIVQPAEIGGLVAWLCSSSAAAVTGQAWSMCGGSTMG